jgi:hypothetical protein
MPPLASTQPDGSYTVVLSDSQKADMRRTVAVIAAVVFVAGVFVGRLTKG